MTKGDLAFAVRAPRLWNILTVKIRHATSSASFKSSLKASYFGKTYVNYYYTLMSFNLRFMTVTVKFGSFWYIPRGCIPVSSANLLTLNLALLAAQFSIIQLNITDTTRLIGISNIVNIPGSQWMTCGEPPSLNDRDPVTTPNKTSTIRLHFALKGLH